MKLSCFVRYYQVVIYIALPISKQSTSFVKDEAFRNIDLV